MSVTERPSPSWAAPAPARAVAGARRWLAAGPRPHIALAVLVAAAFCAAGLARYYTFRPESYDLGIFTQEIRAYAHLHLPVSTIKGPGFDLLGDHFSPLDAVLAPLWWLWPSAAVLVAAQAVLFGVSAGIVSSTAARLSTRPRGLAVGVAYGLSFGLEFAVDAGFHEIALAVPLLAWILRMVLVGRWSAAAWWCVPLLLVKEDMGLTVAALGVVAAVLGRRRLGAALAAGGLGWVLLAVLVLIPAFRSHGGYDYTSLLPHTRGHLDLGKAVLAVVWPASKWQTVAWTLGVTGFWALRSPLVLMVVPTLAWRFAGQKPFYWDIGWHYSAVLMPVVFLAAVDGWRRAEESSRFRWRQWARSGPALVLGVGVAVACAMGLAVPRLVQPSTYSSHRGAAMSRLVALVPDGAVVESGLAPIAQLASRCRVYWAGEQAVIPQYIALDTWWWDPAKDLVAWADKRHPGARYRVAFDQDGAVLLQRTA